MRIMGWRDGQDLIIYNDFLKILTSNHPDPDNSGCGHPSMRIPQYFRPGASLEEVHIGAEMGLLHMLLV
jgi:hypothetical protein